MQKGFGLPQSVGATEVILVDRIIFTDHADTMRVIGSIGLPPIRFKLRSRSKGWVCRRDNGGWNGWVGGLCLPLGACSPDRGGQAQGPRIRSTAPPCPYARGETGED